MTDEFRDLGSFVPAPTEPTSPSTPTETHGDEIGGWGIIGFVLLVVGGAITAVSVNQGDSAASGLAALLGSLMSIVGFFALMVAAVAKGVQIGNRS
ncbi:hypothetical protein ASE12_18640 [Aeromicrobium sp. Root236]|uniref:hypothetical protein n=1 Tax=Aeromicrobium sp. Root236 TaxID=1736498 RepID=UPI0006FBD13E|nr:hypothetical protein [Aeromicrobium sp. Root236]KRC66611.1 hypothetical protein ASE12_18640 [Aeromicrobium sp. Root236]